jgi:cellulose synthase/poly-beta-1,6-N-acetylglucosamine synthase-like glycosyltransferase
VRSFSTVNLVDPSCSNVGISRLGHIMFAFTFYKQVQEYYSKPLISSGLFSMYRTDALLEQGGWSMRTLPRTWT